MFEKMFAKVTDAIREGETIAKPMKEYSKPSFHPVSLFFWIATGALPPLAIMAVKIELTQISLILAAAGAVVGTLIYLLKMNGRVVEDLVINMVDVGEETGELDVMLYKVADYYEEEVRNLTDGMMKLIEPLLIIFLGLVVLFIVMALFLPLVNMISGLS